MKKNLNVYPFAYAAAALLGVIAMFLRYGLYQAGLDDRGLLTAGHPLEIALWVLTGALLVLVLLMVRRTPESGVYEENFPASILAGLGAWFLAAAILISGSGGQRAAFPVLLSLERILRYLGAAALIAAGFRRLRGKKPFFGCHGVAALYFAIHMIVRYQSWSGHPQMQDYVFALLGCICMALFAYQQAAFEVGLGSRRRLMAVGLLGCYLCCAAMARGENQLLYFAGAFWMLTNQCRMQPVTQDVPGEVNG